MQTNGRRRPILGRISRRGGSGGGRLPCECAAGDGDDVHGPGWEGPASWWATAAQGWRGAARTASRRVSMGKWASPGRCRSESHRLAARVCV